VYQYRNGDLFFFNSNFLSGSYGAKGVFLGRMGSAGRAQNKPQKLLFFNFNRRILLKITKRVHGKIFIEFDRTDCKIIAFEVKR
jgi:hypothetical protein